MQKNNLKEAGLTRTLARFITGTKAEDIPPDMYAHAKVAFLDWLAVLMAGKEEPLVLKLIDYAKLMGGLEQATVLGHDLKTNVVQAALINGSASHALDFDDTLRIFLGHPTVTIFPALVALAEWKQKSGYDLLSAYIIALQVGATVGACAGVDHYFAGWHGTSTIGRIASAAGCARLLQLDEQQTAYALGIAGTQAGGLKRVFGTMTKPYHAGKAAQVGLELVLLAAGGFTCVDDILEGADGFFQLLKGAVNPEAAAALGKHWVVDKLAQKYHASCHGTHSPIEAVLDVVQNEKLPVSNIKSITAHVTQTALDVAGKVDPQTGLEGKFSIPYCMANALVTGDTGTRAFADDRIGAPAVKDLMKKITLELIPDKVGMEARVEVETSDGNAFEAYSDVFNDIPELDVKREKVKDKFMDLCVPALGKKRTAELMETYLSLEEVKSMKTLIENIG